MFFSFEELLYEGNEEKRGEIGIGKTVELIEHRHNFPVFVYKYVSSVTPHHVCPQEWDPYWNKLYSMYV